MNRLISKQRWFLAARRRDASRPQSFLDPSGYQRLDCPPGEFHADPFLWQHEGKTWVFFERYRYLDAKGEIACSLLGSPEITTVLKRPYHLSYPHVFEFQGQLWMLPETSENRTVELYRCMNFPQEWKLETTLLVGVDASDATVLEHEGLLWLFASDFDPHRGVHLLHLWSASGLAGPWSAHPRNPVVASARGARPAGRIFEAGGELVRPAQDCTAGYGRGVEFRRIVELTTASYRDEPIGALEPAQFSGWDGLHTYSQSADFEAIDGFMEVPDLFGKLAGVLGKSRRALRGRERLQY